MMLKEVSNDLLSNASLWRQIEAAQLREVIGKDWGLYGNGNLEGLFVSQKTLNKN